MPRSSYLSTIYASDEDVYVLAPGDFGTVAPASNLLAAGADGSFAAGSPWVFSSASNDFAAQGILPGMVVQLVDGPKPYTFRPAQCLAIDSLAGGSAVLRRCGLNLNEGLPPAPSFGLSGVTFRVVTFYPQIEAAAFELDQRYSVDPRAANRNPTLLTDQRIFRRLTVLWVLIQLYIAENRTKEGDWAAKTQQYKDLYDDALATAIVRWGPTGTSQPSTTRFSMRLER